MGIAAADTAAGSDAPRLRAELSPRAGACYTLPIAAFAALGVNNMRVLVLALFVVFAALALGGCPIFTRGAGEGRPLEGTPQDQQQ